jgi:putative ABC transport system ATP-binding protein
MSGAAVRLIEVEFGYRPGKPVVTIPKFEVDQGERLFLFGPSGSGKTTLLGLISGVLEPWKGAIEVLDQNLVPLKPAERDAFRGTRLGYIFQLFNLIPYLNVRENITLPCRFHAGRRARLTQTPDQEAVRLARHLGIQDLLDQPVTSLSVGQQQRVAAARALIGAPELIIADEPTSSLDYDHRERFLELVFDSVKEAGSTLLFVSHDRSLMPLFDRVLSLTELNTARG